MNKNMDSVDPRKQKRLGPAPIASFEKSFEDNTQLPCTAGITESADATKNMDSSNWSTRVSNTSNIDTEIKITTTTTTAAAAASTSNATTTVTTTTSVSTTSTSKLDENKGRTQVFKHERPKVSPPDPPQHPQQQKNQKISVSIPAKKLHDISKRPPPIQCSIEVSGASGSVSGVSEILHKTATLSVNTPSTPRIDISRASSSSQHEDSRESSPENVFEQVGTGTLQEALGFREEGALDLRSSTEELFFMDPEQKKEEKEKMQQARKSPIIFKFDDHQTYLQQHQRKDSASSEVAALLCISGRTSRISSVGSQGSAISRLSAISGISGVSRSPSPHRMLLETSFCGPKPLENVVDGSGGGGGGGLSTSNEQSSTDTLENVLLARKHDPTAVVLAEGIKIESSPSERRKILANGGAKKKSLSHEKATSADIIKSATTATSSSSSTKLGPRKTYASSSRRDSGKQVVGVTQSGTKYIRINLKPDHLYPDRGIAPNEKIIEVSSGGPGTTNKNQDKPSSLQISRDTSGTNCDRLTPTSSPKPAGHKTLTKDGAGITVAATESRSPSPGIGVLRKSSFCSLFKAKDSPDSPRDRSRSKSRERQLTPQSQSGTPSKQKSVLAIFRPKRSASKSKCSSPIDPDAIAASQHLDGISQVEFKFNSDSGQQSQDRSRPASRLRYYDSPPEDGKGIHIPLHTPPDEKDVKKIISNYSQQIKSKEQRPMSAPTPVIAPSLSSSPLPETTPICSSSSTVKKPIQKEIIAIIEQAPALPIKSPKPPQIEKIQRIENLDAIHSLPQDVKDKERTWSMEVQRHSSQESQETVISAEGSNATGTVGNSANSNNKKSKSNLGNVVESPLKENGVIKHPTVPPPDPPVASSVQKVTVQQSQQQQMQQQHSTAQSQSNEILSKEKKRILFATRIGSGSQEQIFSTQFSLSKTESLSSQLSEQTSIPESPAEGREAALHRSDTVIRRPEELQKKNSQEEHKLIDSNKESSSADEKKVRAKSSEDEDKRPVIVMMRRKDSDDVKRKSKSASEDDDGTHRHSKYLENFDVRKQRFNDHQKRNLNTRQSSDSSIKESRPSSHDECELSKTVIKEFTKPPPSISPLIPPPPPATASSSDRQSVISTDDPIESSESERDSESTKSIMDPNRIKRHLPRHIGIIEDHESTGLVSQESFDDELPYVPTTLPEERALGTVTIIPMKERAHMEVKTFSLDRPRSTTPMNPAHLEEYCGTVTPDDKSDYSLIRGEKLRISLPKKDSHSSKSQQNQKSAKSPRRSSNTSGKSWFEFAEQGIRGTTNTTSSTATITTPTFGDDKENDLKFSSSSPPPPLPPRKPSSTSISSGQWVNFENIPEKRKVPKRITALPKDGGMSSSIGPDAMSKEGMHYNYVKPEECQCECHEVERESHKSIQNVDLLKQGNENNATASGGEDMQPLLDSDCHEGIDPSDSSQDYDYGGYDNQSSDERRRYEIDTPSSSLRNSRSNQSSGQSEGPESSPDRNSGQHRHRN